MKKILILGAGLSSVHLISYLLGEAQKNNWSVTVADRNIKLAKQTIKGHSNGAAVSFDVNDAEMRSDQIERADLVINMLPPNFRYLIALDCVYYARSMISASYGTKRINDLNRDAKKKGVLILTEVGLDPGIDHMIAMSQIDNIRSRGGKITSFKSYAGALPAPDSLVNPLSYFVTWNPRNIVMAGEGGAEYLEDSKIKMVPYHNLFQRTWPIEVDGIGPMEVYPNRDTLTYLSSFDISRVKTFIRGTIRYPGWCETWLQIVRLGLPNETLRIPNLHKLTYRDFVELFTPSYASGAALEQQVASFLQINPTGQIMQNLKWFGLFSSDIIGNVGETACDVLIHLMKQKLNMPTNCRDMIILFTEINATYGKKNQKERIAITLTELGEQNGFSAIAKTVGLPIGVSAKLILEGKIKTAGCQIPTHPEVYKPVLKELRKAGLEIKKKVTKT